MQPVVLLEKVFGGERLVANLTLPLLLGPTTTTGVNDVAAVASGHVAAPVSQGVVLVEGRLGIELRVAVAAVESRFPLRRRHRHHVRVRGFNYGDGGPSFVG